MKKSSFKRLILDTDIGIDCDDAAALAILLNAQRSGKCFISAITASTTREGAVATVRAICRYYGVKDIPMGKLIAPALDCDLTNTYAYAVKEKYGEEDTDEDAVCVLRRTLARSEEGMDVIAIGPETNICRLLKSGADEFSPLNGRELVAERVGKLYVMGGSFADNGEGRPFPEFNIKEDIKSARYIAERWPTEIVYVPFEVGEPVFTEMGKGDNPVWYAMLCHNNFAPGKYRRESWDPITCMVALDEGNPMYRYSVPGRVEVTEEGITRFIPDSGGNRRYMSVQSDLKLIERVLNESIEG